MTIHYFKTVNKTTGETVTTSFGHFDNFKAWQAEESRGGFAVIEITRDEYHQSIKNRERQAHKAN